MSEPRVSTHTYQEPPADTATAAGGSPHSLSSRAVGLHETSFLAATAEHPTMLVTGILDLDAGRLVDVLPARSPVAVTAWLTSNALPWLAGIRHVVIDPYQPYATAVAAGLPDARLVVDHFHVIRLANAARSLTHRQLAKVEGGEYLVDSV